MEKRPVTASVLGAVLLLVLEFSAYWSATSAGWIWDDDVYVTDNPLLAQPGGLVRIWSEPAASPQYYPLVFTTFLAERAMFGEGPGAHHVTNLAEELYRRALAAVPGLWQARVNLGGLLSRTGRAGEALEHLETAVRARPGDSRAATEFGVTLLRLGRTSEAVRHFENIAAKEPDSVSAGVHLCQAYAMAGRAEDAAGELERVRRLNPGAASALESRFFGETGESGGQG